MATVQRIDDRGLGWKEDNGWQAIAVIQKSVYKPFINIKYFVKNIILYIYPVHKGITDVLNSYMKHDNERSAKHVEIFQGSYPCSGFALAYVSWTK